ncbi:MAG: lipid-binding SYLF domain-containing protein [Nitrospinaceae bacterium]
MRPYGLILLLSFALSSCALQPMDSTSAPPSVSIRPEELLAESINLLKVMRFSSIRTVNENMLGHAKAIVIFPLVVEQEYHSKAAFGTGVVSMRSEETGKWGPPLFHKLMGVNFGQWAGLKAWDLIFLVVSDKGKNALFNPAYQFGQEISMAFGPMDNHPRLPIQPILTQKDIYVYSRAQGSFVGLPPEGGMINNDRASNIKFYGSSFSPKEILQGQEVVPLPEAAKKFMKEMDRLAPVNLEVNAT